MLLNLGEPGGLDITPWADRIKLVDVTYDDVWELPGTRLGQRARGGADPAERDVAWVGEKTRGRGLTDALTSWFGLPAAA